MLNHEIFSRDISCYLNYQTTHDLKRISLFTFSLRTIIIVIVVIKYIN